MQGVQWGQGKTDSRVVVRGRCSERHVSPTTGLTTLILPLWPHPGSGRSAGSDGGCSRVHLRLGDGVLPYHALHSPCQVGLDEVRPPDWQLLGTVCLQLRLLLILASGRTLIPSS